MPELPEVETVRRDMQESLPKKTVAAISVFDPKLAASDAFAHAVGKQVDSVGRRGKYLILRFRDDPRVLVFHLRMTGQIIFRDKKRFIASGHPSVLDIQQLPDKHVRMTIALREGGELFFRDSRRFGTVLSLQADQLPDYFRRFGLEPFTADWSFEKFKQRLTKKNTTIKTALLDQSVIFGLGNIYADESCFAAKIPPFLRISKLREADLKALFNACGKILEEAVEARGTSMRDYVDSNGGRGGYAEKMAVYGRKGQPCPVCGHPIAKISHAGRGTHYCMNCQG